MTTCSDFRRRLEKLIDGELSPQEEARVEEHVGSCPRCSRQLEFLAPALANKAVLNEKIMPKRDLWPNIKSRIASEAQHNKPGLRRQPVLLMAAAIAAAISLVVLSYYRDFGNNLDAQHPGSVRHVSTQTDAIESCGVTYASIQADMEGLRSQLLEVMEARGDEISPATRRVVLDNLELIDDAIARIVGALEEDPNSPELNRLLLAAYESELGILRQISRLPAAS
jgi:hypothetical protein